MQAQYPSKLSYLHTDVTSEDSVARALEAVVQAEGRFDGMIANAGMTRHQPALEFSMAQVEQLFKLNVFGAWNCATAAARTFIRLGTKGAIVFTASMTSYRPNRVSENKRKKEKHGLNLSCEAERLIFDMI